MGPWVLISAGWYNAALRTIVRRDSGEGYRQMLKRMAVESGIETPSAEDLVRIDRARKGKKLSNADWVSKTDPDAKIAKMKDGTTHLAYKPEHAVDLDTGAGIAAELHPADRGDTTTLAATLTAAEANLETVDKAPMADAPADLVTDKGYFGRAVLKPLEDGPWKTRIAEPKGKGVSRWRGDDDARRAVYNNRARLLSGVAKAAFRLRAEIVERSVPVRLSPTPTICRLCHQTAGRGVRVEMDVLQRDDLPFPASLPAFQRLFPDDAACAAYLEKARWGNGFVCPHCHEARDPFRFANRPAVLRCRKCRRDTGLTVGTVMERTHTPLSVWFWAAYLVSSQTDGMSATQFQRQLGLSDPSQAALRDGASGSGPDRRHP